MSTHLLEKQLQAFRHHFEDIGTEQRAQGEKAYLKSEFLFLGVDVPTTRKTAKIYLKEHPEIERPELLALVELLWESGVFELCNLGSELLMAKTELLLARDLSLVEALIRKTDTWAHVDKLAADVAGPLVRRFKSAPKVLRRWNKDPNFWIRRASILALLRDLRAGEGDFALFESLALPLVPEREFFIRKAIGWVLRDTAKARPDMVCAFLDRHVEELSPLSVRVATKHLEEPLRLSFLERNKKAAPARRTRNRESTAGG